MTRGAPDCSAPSNEPFTSVWIPRVARKGQGRLVRGETYRSQRHPYAASVVLAKVPSIIMNTKSSAGSTASRLAATRTSSTCISITALQKALAAIELKVGKFEPVYPGKVGFYVNLLNEKERAPGDAPSLGFILCAENESLEGAMRNTLRRTTS
jgi:hypothetical protein